MISRILTKLAVVWLVFCGALIVWALMDGATFEKGASVALPLALCAPVILLLLLAWAFK